MPRGIPNPKPPAPPVRWRKRRDPLEDDTLFAFVIDYTERNKGQWPTLRTCADHFGTTLIAIENAIETFDQTDKRGMDLIVAYRSGSGVAEIANKGDYEVEAWSDGEAD